MLATSDGELTVLDGHTPLVGDVVPCELKLEQPDGPLMRFAVHGGFLQVDTSPRRRRGPGRGRRAAAGALDPGDGAGRGRGAGRGDRRGRAPSRRGTTRRSACGRPQRRAVGAPAGEEVEVDVELVEAKGSLDRAELRLSVAAGEA